MKKILRLIPCIVMAMIGYSIRSYLNPTTTNRSTDKETLSNETSKYYKITKITDWLESPSSMIWTSPTRILVTEKWWYIKVMQNNIQEKEPIYTIEGITNEEWLINIVMDPQYTDNKRLYIAYAYTQQENMRIKIVRVTDKISHLDEEKTIIDKLAATPWHAGTTIVFGPDGKLYITVGDATAGEKSQFPDYNNGKILRINADGTIPKDNPFPGYATRSIWHRNGQWLARNSKGELYESEQGPNIIDGSPGGDEINHIITWWNYGRPVVSHEQSQTGMINPIAIYTPAIEPTSLMIYKGTMFPERKDQLFMGMWKGEWILKIIVDAKNADKIA